MVWKTFVMNQLALSVLFNILTTEHKSTMILLKNTQKLTLIKELMIHLTLSMLKTFQLSLQWNHTVFMSTLRKKIDMFAIYISSRVKTILKMKHGWETQKLIALFLDRKFANCAVQSSFGRLMTGKYYNLNTFSDMIPCMRRK